ncbi:PREDICTED: nucleolin-like [Dinoponera quadriceps]|uniref:Nucleolin-like n=1 Tax=Dinoponera quadriceps TaxID=609295 RepID=A0A6P3X7X2_DINQU|nr:PREDICTED: nucleolin-like [Dinoponera quadriceps]XP_014474501.1 PREDICTED: nucleolin-like [Dinoponera quadriceps]
MKTISMPKKGKKRLLREISPPSKPNQKSKNVVESKKKHKKGKIDNTVQNGDPVLQTNVQVSERVNKRRQRKKSKKVKGQNDNNVEMLSKAKIKANIAEKAESTVVESQKKITDEKKEKKLEHLKNKQLIRGMNKTTIKKGRYKLIPGHMKVPLDLDRMKETLAKLRSGKDLSKTAKKRIGVLLRKIAVAEAENKSKKLSTIEEDNDNQHQVKKSLKNKQKAKPMDKKKTRKGERRRNRKANIEIEQNNQNDNDENDEDQSDTDENDEDMEKEDEATDFGQTEVDVESVEDDSDQRDDDETAIVEAKKKKEVTHVDESSGAPIKKNRKKKRYVLLVGNLPHDITTNQLKQHFLTKVSKITNIKINQHTKAKGFARVVVSNSADYEKGLSLNHTLLRKKRISVQFTSPKNLKKVDIVAKNKKLEALRKTEKLANVREKKKLLKKGKQKFTGL